MTPARETLRCNLCSDAYWLQGEPSIGLVPRSFTA